MTALDSGSGSLLQKLLGEPNILVVRPVNEEPIAGRERKILRDGRKVLGDVLHMQRREEVGFARHLLPAPDVPAVGGVGGSYTQPVDWICSEGVQRQAKL